MHFHFSLILCTLLLLYYSNDCGASSFKSTDIRRLTPGTTLRGTTKNSHQSIQLSSFFNAGQVLFNLSIPKDTAAKSMGNEQIIRVTTCSEFTKFDTVLFAFEKEISNREHGNFSLGNPFDMNDNDCELLSTLEIPLSPDKYIFILLSGYGSAEGQFEIRANFISTPSSLPLSWGLDRIDQRSLPLDNKYSVSEGGKDVYVYVLDSGVRISHSEFLNEDGSRRAFFGIDIVDRLRTSVDGNGHGTHVAGIIAGKNFGVAKRAVVISVRVLDRRGIGYIARLVEGIEWAVNDVQENSRHPAVITMSLSTPRSSTLNNAVARVVELGIPVITAAGNSMSDSCSFSPASEVSAITVGSINQDDNPSGFSNFGNCIDIFAPGEKILSAWHTGSYATKNLSGTSAACPHVAGTVAALLALNPSLKPREISMMINTTSTKVAVKDDIIQTNSSHDQTMRNITSNVNNLVYIRPLPTLLRDPTPTTGKIFIFAVLALNDMKYNSSNCVLTKRGVERTSSFIASSTSTTDAKPKVNIVLCCSNLILPRCDLDAPPGTSRIVMQLETRDYQARSIFLLLETVTKKSEFLRGVGSALSTHVQILYDPWVIDSKGRRYWAAPSLNQIQRVMLSKAQLALVGCAASIFLIFALALSFCVIHKRKEAKRQAEKEEFERKAAEFELSKEQASNLRDIQKGQADGYRREGIKRMNTDLFGDVLKNMKASAGLITPRFFGGINTPRKTVQDGGKTFVNVRVKNQSTYGTSSGGAGDLGNMIFTRSDDVFTPQSGNHRVIDNFTPQSRAFHTRGWGPFSSFYGKRTENNPERSLSRAPTGNRPPSSIQATPKTAGRRIWETGQLGNYRREQDSSGDVSNDETAPSEGTGD